ncbi:MAG: hypothetical protein MET45_04775 [Nostoc sp. LLA-1]|nr:hypothetical protein [Cyanocohniella sp. LLY]
MTSCSESDIGSSYRIASPISPEKNRSPLRIAAQISMTTARGEGQFNLYEGRVIIDDTEFTVPVHVGDDVPDTLMGSAWLDIMQLVVNKSQGILTLEIVQAN